MNAFLYVIEIETYKGESWYKVGESVSDKRPEALCRDYMRNSKSKAEIILKKELPYSKTKKKRLNDKYVHKELEALGYKRVAPSIMQSRVHSARCDGITEVFEAICGKARLFEDIEIIMKRAKQKDYSAKISGDAALDYNNIKHLVSYDKFWFQYLNTLTKKYSSAEYKTCLLIGQFDKYIIHSLRSRYDNLVVLSDDCDNYKAGLEAFIANELQVAPESYEENIIFINTYNEIEELNMKFDLIISNPPYGKIGAEITDSIWKNVEYDLFINLLPLTDYADAAASDELPKYIVLDSLTTIDRGAFKDAAVTTAICVISKEQQNPQATKANIKLCSGKFGILNKFFERNARSDYKLPIRRRNFEGMDDKYPVAIGHRDAAHGHLPYSKTWEWQFNVGMVSRAEYADKRQERLRGEPTGNLTSNPIFFDTKAEADNYKKFIYSKDGFRFVSMIWTTYKTDSSEAFDKCFLRVDWSKPQTVRSILQAYDYAEDEIAEVISGLGDYPAGEMCE